MALTRHQQKHLNALKLDAEDISDGTEKTRVLKEANDILDGREEWPDIRLQSHEIHDWVENPVERTTKQDELSTRSVR